MNKNILNTGVQEYIRNFSSSDILAVALAKQLFEDVSNKELVQQLESRKKCQHKLPLWYSTEGIFYPDKKAVEQSSSETTARYKAELVSGNTMLDLTGGMGVDSYFFSQKVDRLVYCEKQSDLARISTHNFGVLGAKNIHTISEDGIKLLNDRPTHYDWIYLDPSRRTHGEKRVFLLEDAEPSLPEALDLLWKSTSQILIKTSPWLDLSAGMDALNNVREIHIVAVKNEVKEILWYLQKDYAEETVVKTINIRRGKDHHFNFKFSEERTAENNYSPPLVYLYEPNAALMKSGAYKLAGARYGLLKLHEHSHLYTSDKLVDFPGRRFRLVKALDYNRKMIRKLQIEKAQISVRNFPESVENLRKKLEIKDGGDQTLYFTRDLNSDLVVLVCERVPDQVL